MPTNNKGRFYSGTSGLVLPFRNKSFYPAAFQDKSRLTYYGSLFNSIEINSSFYKLPRLVTMQKWADSVPPGFRFTYKLWKDITHVRDLLFEPAALELFMRSIDIARKKKGCLLIQFPAGLKFSAVRQLRNLLQALKSNAAAADWKLNVEFRDSSWYREDTFGLLREYGCGIVIHDKKGSETSGPESGADYVYLRFHGPQGDYRGSYDDGFLHEYAQYIREWLDSGKEVYVYFNNTMGDAVRNLITLNKYMS